MHLDQNQVDVLNQLDGTIESLYQRHQAKQATLWMPSELIPEDYAPPNIAPELKAMLVLNLLTEDGLPYFLSLLVTYLGTKNAIWKWNRRWTAEEDRHGAAINLYLSRHLTRAQKIAVERQQFAYLNEGFWPEWGNLPYRLLAYVVFQEMATQRSHGSIAREARNQDPVLAVFMGRIAGEEKAHHDFYLGLFSEIVSVDPENALPALLYAAKHFFMPGAAIPEFGILSELQERRGVFGKKEYAGIIEHVNNRLGLQTLMNLGGAAEQARDKLMKLPRVILKSAERSSVNLLQRENRSHTILGGTLTIQV